MQNMKQEILSQTSIRGLAALVVFFAHAGFGGLFPEIEEIQRVYSVVFWHNEAVDLFFILSGFVLCYVYREKVHWPSYAVARFARIYPVYIVSLLVILGMNLTAAVMRGNVEGVPDKINIFTNALLIQDWPIGLQTKSINYPTWSISTEIFLYILVFPILWKLIRKSNLWVVVMLGTFSVLLMLVHLIGGIEQNFFIARGVLGFSCGFFVCILTVYSQIKLKIPTLIEGLFLLVLASSLMIEFPLSRPESVILFPLLIGLTAIPSTLVSRKLTAPIFLYFGALSYSIYVWHYPVIKVATLLTGMRSLGGDISEQTNLLSRVCFCAMTILGVLLVSHISHYYFEIPLKDLIRSRIRTSRQGAG